jgi:hypothetical protein
VRRAARSLAARHGPSRDRPSLRLPAAAAVLVPLVAGVAGVAGTAGVGAAVARTDAPDEHAYLYRPAAELAARLDRAVPSGRTIELLGSLDIATMPIKPALRYFLVRHHVRPLAPGSFVRLGSWYELYDRPYQEVAYVEDGTRAPVHGAHLLDRVHFGSNRGPQTVSLWLSAHGRPGRNRASSERTLSRSEAG